MRVTPYFVGRLPQILSQLEEPIFHGLGNCTLPLTRIPGKSLVLTVHDIIPELLPETVSTAYRWQSRLWLSRSLHVADRIICDSRRTRDDLLAHFEVDSGKLTVVHLGVDHVDAAPPLDPSSVAYLDALSLPQRYGLYAGSLDVRKNVACILDALERLKHWGQPLAFLIIGQPWYGSGALQRRVEQLRATGCEIRMIGFQPPSILYELMRRSSVFVFPSRYEGFGLPPLEAMYLGVPTIISNAGALPEICGDSAMQTRPDDSEDLAHLIQRVMRASPDLLARAEAGRKWASRFTWQSTGRATIEVYRSLLC
jgi:glycosyltransferase involved in cell wall biosynthesis